jgi:4-hydroxybenzoate polyprenyltransferase
MKSEEVTVLIKWIATIITLLGAICTAAAIDPLNIWLLNTGSIVFLIWSFRIKDLAMITVNAGLLGIYTLGTVLRLI